MVAMLLLGCTTLTSWLSTISKQASMVRMEGAAFFTSRDTWLHDFRLSVPFSEGSSATCW